MLLPVRIYHNNRGAINSRAALGLSDGILAIYF